MKRLAELWCTLATIAVYILETGILNAPGWRWRWSGTSRDLQDERYEIER